jgi:hypothetical protein
LPITITLLTCGFPTDESERLLVTLAAPSDVLVRGDSIVLFAQAVVRDASGGETVARGVTFGWVSDNPAVAAVSERPDGSGLVVGVNRGIAEIRAIPHDYEEATPGVDTFRITNSIEIDSVRPDVVRYGQQITVYGTGLGRVVRMTLGESNLTPDATSFVGDSAGVGQQRFWVAYPAISGRILAVAEEGFSAPAAATTTVITSDVYDVPGEAPPIIDLAGSPRAADDVLFSNPALALTSPGESKRNFHFIFGDTTRSVTFIVTTNAVLVRPYLPTLSSGPVGRIPDAASSWATGSRVQFCRTDTLPVIGPKRRNLPFTIMQAFRTLPGPDIYLNLLGNGVGRFGLEVRDGYQVTDPRVPSDRFEENDYCVAADANFRDPTRRIDALPFSDTLTIDNPFELDWIRFKFAPLAGQTEFDRQFISVRAEALPFGAADSSDLNLSLVGVNDLFFGEWEATEDAAGSSELLVAELLPGEYYLMIGDGAGVPTRYSLCIGRGVTC